MTTTPLLPRPTRRLVPAVLLLATLAGCDDDPTPPPPPRMCTVADAENLDITVTTGTTPTFSWTPVCAVQRISVYQPLATATEVWRVRSAAGMGPGVRYGRTPSGAATQIGPVALEAGEEAVVEVAIGTDQALNVIGGAAFTP